VDVEDVVKALGEINKTAAVHACSLVCAWSPEEVARYLETFKLYENKTAENIQERTENDYASRLTGALCKAWQHANIMPLTPHALQAR
jgi:DNA excision repair protein ERCC-1